MAEEYMLWFWVASMILEEILEITSEHSKGTYSFSWLFFFFFFSLTIYLFIIHLGYLYQFTNQVDVGIIVSLPQVKKKKTMTYRRHCTWPM